MQIARHSINVKCKPDNLPEAIVVDVTELGIADSVHVGDIEPPEGVEFLLSPKLAVCAVIAPSKEEEPEEEEGEEGEEGEVAEGEEAAAEETEE